MKCWRTARRQWKTKMTLWTEIKDSVIGFDNQTISSTVNSLGGSYTGDQIDSSCWKWATGTVHRPCQQRRCQEQILSFSTKPGQSTTPTLLKVSSRLQIQPTVIWSRSALTHVLSITRQAYIWWWPTYQAPFLTSPWNLLCSRFSNCWVFNQNVLVCE